MAVAGFEWPYTMSLSVYNFPEYPLAISLYVVFCLLFLLAFWRFCVRIIPSLVTSLIILLVGVLFSPVYIDGDPSYFAPAWVGVFLGFVTQDYNLIWLSIAPLLIGVGLAFITGMGIQHFYHRIKAKQSKV